MKKGFLKFLFIAVGMFIITPISSLSAASKLPVFVSIVPQKYFVEKIGKEWVDVGVMVQPGASPATYEPKPRQMVALSKARLYFSIGVPFENTWLERIATANPNMKVIHTDMGIQKIAMKAHHNEEKLPQKNQTPSSLDPHIWLSPTLVMHQAKIILTELQRIDPEHRTDYEINYKAFISEIVKLDRDLLSIFSNQNGLQFIVFHPSWGYFARDYRLKQVPIEIEGKSPKPAQLKELIKHALENQIRVVFVQPQFSARSAKLIAKAIRGEVVYANPLAENWIKNLQDVARKLKQALK